MMNGEIETNIQFRVSRDKSRGCADGSKVAETHACIPVGARVGLAPAQVVGVAGGAK